MAINVEFLFCSLSFLYKETIFENISYADIFWVRPRHIAARISQALRLRASNPSAVLMSRIRKASVGKFSPWGWMCLEKADLNPIH